MRIIKKYSNKKSYLKVGFPYNSYFQIKLSP